MMISVALAAWRGERYLPAQMETLLTQTRMPDEIVICDDSPDDGTHQAITTFLEKHACIRYVHNDTPLGVSANFEKALTLCRGDVIFLCDQDDLWEMEKIEKMAALFPQDNGIPAGVFCDSLLADENGIPSGGTHWESRGFASLKEEVPGLLANQLPRFLRRVPAAGHDMAVNRALRDLCLPFPSLPQCHDTWIGTVGALFNAWRICPKALTRFRRHGEALSGSGKMLNWRDQLAAAKKSAADNTFAWNASLYFAALERFPLLPPEVRLLLTRRRDHSAARARMSGIVCRRLPLILQEIGSGNYFRFGRGMKSIVQDLFFR